MINTKDILETINMIKDENLDIRTITMGISLYDCAGDDINVVYSRHQEPLHSRTPAGYGCCPRSGR